MSSGSRYRIDDADRLDALLSDAVAALCAYYDPLKNVARIEAGDGHHRTSVRGAPAPFGASPLREAYPFWNIIHSWR